MRLKLRVRRRAYVRSTSGRLPTAGEGNEAGGTAVTALGRSGPAKQVEESLGDRLVGVGRSGGATHDSPEGLVTGVIRTKLGALRSGRTGSHRAARRRPQH